MSDVNANKITKAATKILQALEGLSTEESARVLQAAATLYGVSNVARKLNSDIGDTAGPINTTNGGQTNTKRLSLVEFLQQKHPTTNMQRLVAFAYYREHLEGKANFARADLLKFFSVAKLAAPGNFDRDFAKVVRKGWIHENGAESYLTQAGENAVKAGFSSATKDDNVDDQ